MSLEKQVLLFILLVIALHALRNILSIINSHIDSNYEKEYLKYGFVSRKNLSKLNQNEFTKWCCKIVGNLGYNSIEITTNEYTERNLICKDKSGLIYVKCTPLKLKDTENDKKVGIDEDNYETLGRPDIQKLVGEMVHDKVNNAVVITNGDFSNEVLEYIGTLPSKYSIKLINGIELTKQFRKIRQHESSLHFEN